MPRQGSARFGKVYGGSKGCRSGRQGQRPPRQVGLPEPGIPTPAPRRPSRPHPRASRIPGRARDHARISSVLDAWYAVVPIRPVATPEPEGFCTVARTRARGAEKRGLSDKQSVALLGISARGSVGTAPIVQANRPRAGNRGNGTGAANVGLCADEGRTLGAWMYDFDESPPTLPSASAWRASGRRVSRSRRPSTLAWRTRASGQARTPRRFAVGMPRRPFLAPPRPQVTPKPPRPATSRVAPRSRAGREPARRPRPRRRARHARRR